MVIRVMIVDDEPLLVQAHRDYLARIGGFEVVATAGTAQDAHRAAAAAVAAGAPVELVLLDLGLPDASGIDLASALSGLRPDPDIIAITAARDLPTVRRAVAHGALLYLLKPFSYAAFAEKIEHYLRYRDTVAGDGDAVSQRDVDRALAALRTADPRRSAPKGMAPDTTDAVGRAVRDAPDGLTASEVAARVGSSRVTAWRYLERLADAGTVRRVTEYGGAGRPQIRYTWTR